MERRVGAPYRELAMLTRGAHVCHLYRDEPEQAAVALDFFLAGKARGEKCLMVAEADYLQARGALLHDVLAPGGTPAENRQEAGSWTSLAAADDESFEAILLQGAADAIKGGFKGLRVIRVMESGWQTEEAAQSLSREEALLNERLQGLSAIVMCQYGRHQVSAGFLKQLIHTHPLIFWEGALRPNFYFTPAQEYLSSDDPAAEVGRLLHNISRSDRIAHLKREWMASVAHQLRTPLTSILGYAELLMQEGESGGFDPLQQREFLAEICEKVEVLSGIIRDLMDPENSRAGGAQSCPDH